MPNSSMLRRLGGLYRLRKTRREGAILGLVLVTMVILSFLGIGLIKLSLASAMEAGRTVSTIQSFWNAEAGVEQVKAIAQKKRRPANIITLGSSPSGYLSGSNSVSGTTASGTFAVDVYDDPGWTNASSNLKRYIIRSRGRSPNGKEQTVTLRAQIKSFASYMHSSNYERASDGTLIYFLPGDRINGPVYVNDRLNISGGAPTNPVFLQSVSSATNSVNYINGANTNVFQSGLTLNAPKLDISGQFTSDHISDLEVEANEPSGLALSGDYQLIFDAAGTVKYYPRSGGVTNTVYLSALNGAIYVDGDVWVQGQVNGKVTVAAQDSIYISNSITYASAASPGPWDAGFNTNAVDDTLGLMAYNRFEIRGTNTVNIHAAIMVTTGDDGFGAENRYVNIGGNKYINLYGSLSQYRRGIVSQNGSTFRGFRKNYKYDTRFDTDAPPNYPYSVYEFGTWKHSGI